MSSKRSLAKKDTLLIALRKGQADRIDRILSTSGDDGEVSANMDADTARNSVLHRAARYGHLDVVRVLLKHDADPNRTNKFGMTPLHHAAVAGADDVATALIGGGARADKCQDDKGRTPLHWAAGNGFVKTVLVLLEEGKAKAEVSDEQGWTPLHRCCQEKPPEKKPKNAEEPEESADEKERRARSELRDQDRARSEIALALLKGGADADARDAAGRQTPLHLCAMNGYARTAQILLEQGNANIDAVNKISQTPLIYACMEGHADVVRVLLQFRPDLTIGNVHHWDWTPMHWAVMQDNVEILEILLDEGYADIEIKDKVGRTPLKVADEHFKEESIKFLEKRISQKKSGRGKKK